MPEIVQRHIDQAAYARLIQTGIEPRLARLYAARGISHPAELQYEFSALLPPETLTHAAHAAHLLADAIAAKQKLLIIADYDADGATACAVAMRALSAMGAVVDFLVPNRFEYGYGLTPEIVQLAAQQRPDWLITVDNGIASVEGVAEANRLGMRVLITDHHLPGECLPEAAGIVNPNQPGCAFASKNLAGVGVIFYLMLALRAELRKRNVFALRAEPNLAQLLDLVALGTVADVVRLDRNNRILVEQGLARIRAGRASPGIAALLQAAGRDPARVNATDLGFFVGPRLNAAGRLTDMSLGIACLLANDAHTAQRLALQLDQLNRERRDIESTMQHDATMQLGEVDVAGQFSICLFDPEWHQGVIGILASRLREKYHRPAIVFAPAGQGEIKGSGRSINALHLRDALDLVTKRYPGLISRFGGHAMAAGLSLPEAALPAFIQAFEDTVRHQLSPSDLHERIETDGELSPVEINLELAHQLERHVWGQAFPSPVFSGRFRILNQRVVGEKHLKLQVALGEARFEAMRFGSPDFLSENIEAIFRLTCNEFRGIESLQLVLEHVV